MRTFCSSTRGWIIGAESIGMLLMVRKFGGIFNLMEIVGGSQTPT